jgi:iron complex transport system substrate-binding protein
MKSSFTLRLALAGALVSAALPLVAVAANAATASAAPACIVSMSPTATATLFAIGAGHQVQAVDEDSTTPAAAAALAKRHVINALSPSVESVLGICTGVSKKPNLVLLSYNPDDFAQKLTALGVKVVNVDAPATFGGALAQIRELGTLTGHRAGANALAARIDASVRADVATLQAKDTGTLRAYYELSSDPYYSLTSTTFVGSLLKRLGLTNIADSQNTTADAGYPELSSEYIISANPQIIFLAGDATAASVAARTGFSGVTAVADHNVFYLGANESSQWGPNLIALANQLTTDIAAAAAHVASAK